MRSRASSSTSFPCGHRDYAWTVLWLFDNFLYTASTLLLMFAKRRAGAPTSTPQPPPLPVLKGQRPVRRCSGIPPRSEYSALGIFFGDTLSYATPFPARTSRWSDTYRGTSRIHRECSFVHYLFAHPLRGHEFSSPSMAMPRLQSGKCGIAAARPEDVARTWSTSFWVAVA